MGNTTTNSYAPGTIHCLQTSSVIVAKVDIDSLTTDIYLIEYFS
jgi:hypothetical protein